MLSRLWLRLALRRDKFYCPDCDKPLSRVLRYSGLLPHPELNWRCLYCEYAAHSLLATSKSSVSAPTKFYGTTTLWYIPMYPPSKET